MTTLENKVSVGGFTLVEVMMASAILLVVLEALFSLYWTSDYLIREGTSTATVQGIARIGMEKMERYLRMGISPEIYAGGDQINFTFDRNANPDSPDTVTRSIYFADADGDESTPADNQLVYDPDIATPGDEETLFTNVRKISGSAIFSASGKVITIALRVSQNLPAYSDAVHIYINTKIKMRN